MVVDRKQATKIQFQPEQLRKFVSEQKASAATGFSVRTFQKDRMLGRNRFPWYKVGGKVLYDLREIERIIVKNRRGGDDFVA